ncbi:MAG: 23S rRNA (pseudouridine(1915)-N(3))-methyltransferase RlmH [Crocinitomicaceae bacterium]|nr:23S rRNA (pseudouridine(1915)-N(3))-methyltransferase RlmH [Crocinitomicaceae bacterium]
MKVRFMFIGKTVSNALKELEQTYEKRLVHYVSYERTELADVKQASSLSPVQLKEKEGQALLSKITDDQHLILLDEKGTSYTSEGFAQLLANHELHSAKKITFCVGGAFGFSDAVYARANGKIALSAMTFSHQMVRMIFLEQLYRACTINKGESYHHS